MKKLILFFMISLMVFSTVLAAPINSKEGYGKLKWGSSVDDAKKAGYTLVPLNSAKDKEFLSQLYSESVDAYQVKAKDKVVADLQFNYFMGRLFCVTEVLNLSTLDVKQLESRYGKFSENGIIKIGNMYMDAQLDSGAKVQYLSLMISLANNYVTVIMDDWNVYKNISLVGQKLSGNEKSKSIVDELDDLAGKLMQTKADGSKASFAIIPFSTDYKNALVENYITDALTESMFNTGSVKIFERENLDAILKEQNFQASGLVNEDTAKSIGMLAGVDFVCYGTLKDVGDAFTVNARVIDVETGEICAMARTNVTKDDYLKNQVQGSVTAKSTSTTKTNSVTNKTTPAVTNNLWQVSSYRNDFDGFTSYTFTVKSTSGEMFVINYKKSDIQLNSRVFAGICWKPGYGYSSQTGDYDIKLDNGSMLSKEMYGYWTNYYDVSGKSYIYVAWIHKAGARWIIDLLLQNNMISLRKNNVVRKFQTAGLLDKMAEVGITWDEIDAAMANEEF